MKLNDWYIFTFINPPWQLLLALDIQRGMLYTIPTPLGGVGENDGDP